ncbi:MFS transporter [Streptoalloteichus hindustanus]|uniref:Drug resistance transporter, EmrB/QacA subfamily n=1 Tax=Streptoalloteichus hindustanus TaxID=2017 RepID=A0A1M4Y5B5_STRHI|nr:MFS transporter [Streptoalloteichus hindustanus]SHF00898.1 drug resistance transporter, EmrB/QacA subfamily [Streptoalloteichus hindustanus]
MPHPRRWWILGVLCTALLVLTVDNMILTLAIPSLMRDLGAGPADVQWILDSYILVFAGVLITAGSLSDRYGRRRLLIIGLVVLGGASLLASLADQPWQLIACRALMGLGAGFAMPSTMSIVIVVFDEAERRKAMSIWGMVSMVGMVAGPTLGGLLLEHFSWGSVFLVNVPLAVVALIGVFALVPESRGPSRRSDPLGVLLSVTGMATVVWAIISLPHEGWSTGVVVALVVAAAALVGFVLWESRAEHPMLPLAIFRSRDFSAACLSTVLLVFATAAMQLAFTQFLQLVLGWGTMAAALAFVPMAVAVVVFNVVGATLAKRVSNKAMIVTGMLTIAASQVVIAMISPGDGYALMAVGLVVMGIGTGLAAPSVYATLMGAIPRDQAGVGSAVNDTVQQGGTALGVAVLGSVLSAAYTAALPPAVPDTARASLSDALATAAATGSAELARTAREAFLSAMSAVSTTAALLSVAGGVLALVLLRPRAAEHTTA